MRKYLVACLCVATMVLPIFATPALASSNGNADIIEKFRVALPHVSDAQFSLIVQKIEGLPASAKKSPLVKALRSIISSEMASRADAQQSVADAAEKNTAKKSLPTANIKIPDDVLQAYLKKSGDDTWRVAAATLVRTVAVQFREQLERYPDSIDEILPYLPGNKFPQDPREGQKSPQGCAYGIRLSIGYGYRTEGGADYSVFEPESQAKYGLRGVAARGWACLEGSDAHPAKTFDSEMSNMDGGDGRTSYYLHELGFKNDKEWQEDLERTFRAQAISAAVRGAFHETDDAHLPGAITEMLPYLPGNKFPQDPREGQKSPQGCTYGFRVYAGYDSTGKYRATQVRTCFAKPSVPASDKLALPGPLNTLARPDMLMFPGYAGTEKEMASWKWKEIK